MCFLKSRKKPCTHFCLPCSIYSRIIVFFKMQKMRFQKTFFSIPVVSPLCKKRTNLTHTLELSGEAGEWGSVEWGKWGSGRSAMWCHSQGGVTWRWCHSRGCHSQGGVAIKLVSQSIWCHRQGGVTIKVVLQSMWCHRRGNVQVPPL